MTAPDVITTPDGRTLAFSQWGLADGSPVFFLHGTPGGRLMRHVGGEYERNGVRAITYDRPGYGGSDRLAGRRVVHAGADIAAIADHTDLSRFAVIGVSGGGPHALAAAAVLPDRVTRCATIVGVAPFTAPDLDYFAGMDRETADGWRELQQGGEAFAVGPVYADELSGLDSIDEMTHLPLSIREMLKVGVADSLAPGPYGLADDFASWFLPWGFDVADVRCETTVMIGRDDTDVPPGHGIWIGRHVPRATVLEVDGDHFGPRVEPEEELLAWAATG
jgi:pimeloyl-ACP methyl ester carboxylesterase